MKKEMICISCPVGCRMSVSCDGEKIIVEGNKCKHGEQYCREEIRDPRRVVTAVVKTDSEKLRYIPVKTDNPLPKNFISDLLKEIYRQKIKFPVRVGGTILTDFKGTGVNVVVTRTVVDKVS